MIENEFLEKRLKIELRKAFIDYENGITIDIKFNSASRYYDYLLNLPTMRNGFFSLGNEMMHMYRVLFESDSPK